MAPSTTPVPRSRKNWSHVTWPVNSTTCGLLARSAQRWMPQARLLISPSPPRVALLSLAGASYRQNAVSDSLVGHEVAVKSVSPAECCDEGATKDDRTN